MIWASVHDLSKQTLNTCKEEIPAGTDSMNQIEIHSPHSLSQPDACQRSCEWMEMKAPPAWKESPRRHKQYAHISSSLALTAFWPRWHAE